MKAYMLTEKLIERLIEIGRDSAHGEYDTPSPRTLFYSILDQLNSFPVEIDEASVKKINFPCRFFTMKQIVGFTIDEGVISGVFIKEGNQ